MARRSPVEFHNYWGTANPVTGVPWDFALTQNLPNQTAFPTYQTPNLQAGDFLYVPDPGPGVSNGQFYVCQDPGLPAQANSVWVPVGQDKFAPKILVGNIPAGDSSQDYDASGFTYFADTGSGNGIQAAFALVATLGFPVDIHIRPGTYDLSVPYSGGPIGTLTVPAECLVSGAGPGTRIVADGSVGANPNALTLSYGSTLRDLSVTLNDDGDSASSAVVTVGDGTISTVRVENVTAVITRGINSTSSVQSVYSVSSGTTAFFFGCDVSITGTRAPESLGDSLCGWVNADVTTLTNCTTVGGDAAVLFSSFTSMSGCRFRDFSSVGVFSSGLGYLTASNCYLGSAVSGVYGIYLGPLSTIACANSQVSMTDAQASTGIYSAGLQGQIVGNQVYAGGVCIDTSAGSNHAIGFNLLTSAANTQLSTSGTDEVAHNILL